MVKRKFKQIVRIVKNQTEEKEDNSELCKSQLVRISNHIQLLGNAEYIVYQPPRGLQKDL